MKAFIVTVEIEMAVVADDANDAEFIARRHLREEDSFAFSYYAREIKGASELRTLDSDLADCYPWGSEGDKTLRELLSEMGPDKDVTP